MMAGSGNLQVTGALNSDGGLVCPMFTGTGKCLTTQTTGFCLQGNMECVQFVPCG
jgi:hypothetical protein